MSFPPRFTQGSAAARRFSTSQFFKPFFLEIFTLCTSPSREVKRSGMESRIYQKKRFFCYCGSGNAPLFVAHDHGEGPS
jgi:hypothetical protein